MVGFAAAINFRGITEWNAKIAVGLIRDSAKEGERIRRKVVYSRIGGSLFAIIGVAVIVISIIYM